MSVGFEIEEKQRILDELVHSSAFGRSDQLRQMLRYIVQEELAGRGDQLSEYSIGVHALGRPAGYAPETDSTVRTRAHELRKRMQDYFRANPWVPWRIELPKGTYRVTFVRVDEPQAVREVTDTAPVAATPGAATPTAPWSRFWLGVLTGSAAALAVAFAVKLLWPLPAGERAAREIWGPLLESGSTASVMLATVPQLWVREFGNHPLPQKDPAFILPAPVDPRFLEWYKLTTLRNPQQLILHRNSDSALGGDAEACIRLAEFLASHGTRVELLHGDRAGELKTRNAIVLGRPEYSRAAAALQPPQGFVVRYLPERREMGIISADGQRSYFRDEAGVTNYGLVTLLTKQTDGGPRRTLVFSGINSDGTDAAMDYLTSQLNLVDLVRELKANHGQVPGSFQIVVRSRSTERRTLLSERVAIQVLAK